MDFSCSAPTCDLSDLARFVCDRHQGIGADGLLLLLPSLAADYRMRIFNADGGEAAMCGNGIRCIASYLFKENPEFIDVEIETCYAVIKCRRFENEIAVNLGAPSILHWELPLEGMTLYVVNTGVPHAVIFVDDLNAIDVCELGRKVRFHPHFAPSGVNVNFACITQTDKLAACTYERGVEAETLSCGTGCAASAFVAMKVKGLNPSVSVLTRGLDTMQFFFTSNDNGECAIEMVGSATRVFEGVIQLKGALKTRVPLNKSF